MLTMKRVVGRLSLAGAAVLFVAAAAQAASTSDQPASVVIYPKVAFSVEPPTDTIIEIANTSNVAVDLHCFYVNATSHCTNNGLACDTGLDCGGIGSCLPGWAETDFSVSLTRNQPFYWTASTGRNRTCAQSDPPTCERLPLSGIGVCQGGGPLCTTAFDCGGQPCIFSGQSNAGTSVPPLPEDLLFVGELKCVRVDGLGNPVVDNSIIGTATIVTVLGDVVDAQSYNAIGIKGNSRCAGNIERVCNDDADCGGDGPCEAVTPSGHTLVLGPDGNLDATYQACPETLIMDHIFDGAPDPIGVGNFYTDLTLIPCSEDFAVGTANLGRSTAQFLVFNEFEQRFSSTLPVTCFDERLISNIDTRNNARSIFSVNVSGTIAGESRIRPIGSGLLGVARVMKSDASLDDIAAAIAVDGLPPVIGPGAGYELHQQGNRDALDLILLP